MECLTKPYVRGFEQCNWEVPSNKYLVSIREFFLVIPFGRDTSVLFHIIRSVMSCLDDSFPS